jgi:DNA-binding transcriptional regulator PaaX
MKCDMKGEYTQKILEALQECALDAIDLFEAFLSAGYGASFTKLNYEFEKRRNARLGIIQKEDAERIMKQRFYRLLYNLKRDGFVATKQQGTKRLFLLTAKGKEKWRFFRSRSVEPLPPSYYPRKESRRLIIVAFDIPEKERRKRKWLRAVLRELGFRMIQKSVWIGKVILPEEFLHDLHRLRLISYIEIFEIGKTGSLRSIF